MKLLLEADMRMSLLAICEQMATTPSAGGAAAPMPRVMNAVFIKKINLS